MSLWIDAAHNSPDEPVCGAFVRTFQNEEQFFAILTSETGLAGGQKIVQVVDLAAGLLREGRPFDDVVRTTLAGLPVDEHTPCSILQTLKADLDDQGVPGRLRACLMECDAPPLFLTRGGELVLLPVLEEVFQGHLARTCQFDLQAGDYLAMVGDRHIRSKGWDRRWGWQEIAAATRRLTDTGCDAGQLRGALARMYRRLAEAASERADNGTCIVAMHVRPMRSATVWTGAPADPAFDTLALRILMAEPSVRVICGDTTAQIAARLLAAQLELEPRPDDDRNGNHPWAEVPPVSRLEGIDLVTEGRVTLSRVREYLRQGAAPSLLSGEDGAARLARTLLAADSIHFIVGEAYNPVVTSGDATGVPVRTELVEHIRRDLEARGKLTSIAYL